MYKIIILFMIFCCIISCSSKYDNIACVCYIFDPDDCSANTYIEIHQDGYVEATEGLSSDTIADIIYYGGELFPDRNLFMSLEEFPDSEYDPGRKMWTYHSYKRPVIKSCILSKKQIYELNCNINSFLDFKEKSKGENLKIRHDNIDWDSYGIVLIMEGKVFSYWENKCSQEERTFLNQIKKISPHPVKPKKIRGSCLVSDDNDIHRIEIKVETEKKR